MLHYHRYSELVYVYSWVVEHKDPGIFIDSNFSDVRDIKQQIQYNLSYPDVFGQNGYLRIKWNIPITKVNK